MTLEKEMATHSSILSWRIPWTEAPGRLQSMGSQGVGHDWATNNKCEWGFLFLKNCLFNWRLITILWWLLPCIDMNQPQVYMCPPSWTPLPLPSPLHPSGLSQCTSFQCPVSSIEFGLVIYFIYGNIHVSMLFSQIIPPSPSPTESKSLFFISVSLWLSRI